MPLTRGGDGAFYGTTYLGGGGICFEPEGCGTIFRIAPTSGPASLVYSFAKATSDGSSTHLDGYNPMPYLLRARDGNLYGMTESGGASFSVRTGTLFRITPAGTKTILYSFGALREVPSNPDGGLVEGADGSFYGVTFYDGSPGGLRYGPGTLFRMVLPGS